MKYVMTVKGHDIQGYWETCKAKTETGAKRAATRAYGGGYPHHIIIIGIEHRPGDIQPITRKLMSGKWKKI